jgi:uracil-DNA glycosylase family 4
MEDIRDEIRRYLLARYRAGMDVAYRIDAPAAPPSKPVEPASERAAPASKAAPISKSTPPDEVPVVTSALPADDIGGTVEQPAKKQSIRYTSDRGAVSQASLFGEPERTDALDLGGYDIGALQKLVSGCQRCELARGRTQTVFGSGNPRARIVFIGEAPGREEDLQGLPFVGRAGQLLTKILAAMGFTREEVYITNILKCRPPGNREPQENEMIACEPYLVRQLELIGPAVICALGRIAAHGLLKTQASLAALRGGVHYYNDVRVAVAYHPAALLRNPNLKREAWEDFQMVRRLYDEATRGGA